MGVPITRTKALTAASVNNISLSQTPLAGGNLLINGAAASGGIATLDTQRRVLFTFAADESARTFVVYGTNQSGAPIQETVAGTNTTAVTTLDFKTVTRISVDAATAGALTVGTNGVGSGSWQSINTFVTPINVNIQCIVAGTVNFTVQGTAMDPNNLPSGQVAPATTDITALAAKAASTTASITDAYAFFRMVINSGTGSVQYTYDQAGVAGP